MSAPEAPAVRPYLDPGFLPAALWGRSYRADAESCGGSRAIRIAVERPSGERWTYDTVLLPDTTAHRARSLFYGERLVKTLLWAWGGNRILNELAFVPVDYRANGPRDEWSGDRGCGVQYFSQQAVGRLLPASGIEVDPRSALAEQLEVLQARMMAGDERAAAIYETIGVFLGYSLAHYADFYKYAHLLILGRVTSGAGGERILTEARRTLDTEFPELATQIQLHTPDEQMKRHGQAVAAASLPRL